MAEDIIDQLEEYKAQIILRGDIVVPEDPTEV